MRITVKIERDVAAALERLRRSRKVGLKQLINEALRRGLAGMAAPETKRKQVRTRSVSLGGCLIGNVDNIGEVLALIEGDAYR